MKVSIVSICRNEKTKIENTVNSILNQTFKDFEYILVDGDSTDGTKEVLQKYANDYPKIISNFISEKDSGIYNAQNKGAKLCRGEYVIFINGGDSLANPTTLAEIFDANPQSEMLTADIIYGNMLIDYGPERCVELGVSPAQITLYHMLQATLWHPASFIKRELFEKFGFYDESLKIVADYDFFLKLIFKHHVTLRYLPVTISKFNTEGIGSSSKYQELHNKERDLCQKRYFDDYIFAMANEMKRLIEENKSLHFHVASLKESLSQIDKNFSKPKALLKSVLSRFDSWTK